MDPLIAAPTPISDIHIAVFVLTVLVVAIINALTIVSVGDYMNPTFHPLLMFCYQNNIQAAVFGLGTMLAIYAEWYLVVMPTMLGFILTILRDNYINGIVIHSEIEY